MTDATAIPAAIVTFHPDSGWPDRLSEVSREHARIVVVDNSTLPEARRHIASIVAATPGATLHSLPSNPGIGAALNLAFSTLAGEGHACAVAYDQDSTPEPGFAAAITATVSAHPRAAVIGANWTDPRRPGSSALFLRPGHPFGLGFRRIRAEHDLTGLFCVITSGACFDLDVWRSLNGFDAGLFLDLVDTDFCLRARDAGYDIAASAQARLLHHRGDKRTVRLLGHDFHPAHAPAFRLRCLSRNRMVLFRRRQLRPLAWSTYELAYGSKLLLDALLLEDRRLVRLAAMLRGTCEGLLNRTGPLRPE